MQDKHIIFLKHNIFQGDFFAMELLSGFLYLHLDLGDGPTKIRSSNKLLNDGAWHRVIIVRNGHSGNVKVDGDGIDFETPGRDTRLEADGPLYVGGIDMTIGTESMRGHRNAISSKYAKRAAKSVERRWIPPVLWTASLGQGFVGCLRDFSINGRSVDVADYAKRQDSGKLNVSGRFKFINKYYILRWKNISLWIKIICLTLILFSLSLKCFFMFF